MGRLNDCRVLNSRCRRFLGSLRRSWGCTTRRHAGRKNKAQKGTGCFKHRDLCVAKIMASVPSCQQVTAVTDVRSLRYLGGDEHLLGIPSSGFAFYSVRNGSKLKSVGSLHAKITVGNAQFIEEPG